MDILVTGAAGFIASYLIPELLSDRHRVTATDVAPMGENFRNVSENLRYIRADMSSEAEIYRLMVEAKPSHVIHLVSLLAGPCNENPGLGFKVNFLSTLNLLEAGLALGCIERFIMTSSISVFGRGLREPVADDADKIPANIYGQTKLACEHLLSWYQQNRGVSVGAVRFPWVFGPGRETGITALYSSKLLDAIAEGKALIIDNPEEKGDWLYVRDAVKALKLLLYAENQRQVAYNIMGSLHTVREAMETAKRVRPDANIKYVEGKGVQSPYPSAYDDSRAREELGWKPDYSLEEAMREHIRIVSKTE